MAKKDIRKSNALIDATYNPGSLYRMRLLIVAIAQVEGEITHKTDVEVSVEGMGDLLDIANRGSLYSELSRAAKELRGMYVTIYHHHDGRERTRQDRTEINVVSSCQYLKSEGRVVLNFTPHIVPYLSGLKGRYKAYRMDQLLDMRSTHGIRLYELILRWEYPSGEKEVSLDQFREAMGISGLYDRLDVLKKRVVNPAIRDINECSDRLITLGYRKAGRRITHLQFKIVKKDLPKAAAAKPAIQVGSAAGQQNNPSKSVPRNKDRWTDIDYIKTGRGRHPYLHTSPFLKMPRWTAMPDYERTQMLLDEIEEGTIRDRKTGQIIIKKGKF